MCFRSLCKGVCVCRVCEHVYTDRLWHLYLNLALGGSAHQRGGWKRAGPMGWGICSERLSPAPKPCLAVWG